MHFWLNKQSWMRPEETEQGLNVSWSRRPLDQCFSLSRNNPQAMHGLSRTLPARFRQAAALNWSLQHRMQRVSSIKVYMGLGPQEQIKSTVRILVCMSKLIYA
jgi:hypothetical protein